jgi:hypothetical protein
MANQQAANNNGSELRKGALTKHGELIGFVANGRDDDGELWLIRNCEDVTETRLIYPEDITGYSTRLYV